MDEISITFARTLLKAVAEFKKENPGVLEAKTARRNAMIRETGGNGTEEEKE